MAREKWYEEITHPDYKYRLLEKMEFETEIRPDCRAEFPRGRPFVSLETNGRLRTEARYAWDGADLCPDVKAVMRASLAHDAVYQLIRKGRLPRKWRAEARSTVSAVVHRGRDASWACLAGILDPSGIRWATARPDR